MRTTVQEAEETEPLLAKNLFDTVRKATDQKIPDALKVAEQLVKLGVADDAIKASRHAGEGIQQLREGVEHAARSVLGDETAALKLAKAELDDLAEQVNREMAQATGRAVGQSRRQVDTPSEPQQGQAGQSGREGGEAPAEPQQRQARQSARDGEAPAEPGQAQTRQAQRQRNAPAEPQQRQAGQSGRDGEAPTEPGQAQTRQARRQGEAPPEPGQAQPEGQQGQGGAESRNAQGARQAASRGGAQNEGNQREDGRQAAGGGGGGGGGTSGLDRILEGTNRGPGGPIAGEGFRQWSDRMRDVEELIENPELRSGVARVRDRVRGEREEIKRHARLPDWNKLKDLVIEPLAELRERIAEEVRRRESPDALVPIDRDPVPPQFAEGVRRYYERLGSGR